MAMVDWVVASDIVFAKELHEALAGLLRDLLSVSTATPPIEAANTRFPPQTSASRPPGI